jgi:hypothetical protein
MIQLEKQQNHPWTTQEPHISYSWNDNSNTSPLCTVSSPEDHLNDLPLKEFRYRVNNLSLTGFSVLDVGTFQCVNEMYIDKYVRKTETTSENDDMTKKTMTATYYNQGKISF